MTVLIAAACLLLLDTQGQGKARSMKLEVLEYLVADLPEYPQRLTIAGNTIRYESHSNLSQPGSLGIGVFERTLSRPELERIESELDPVSFRSLPDHHGQVLSGDRWKRIRLTA